MAKYCKSTPNNTDFHFILDPASKKKSLSATIQIIPQITSFLQENK